MALGVLLGRDLQVVFLDDVTQAELLEQIVERRLEHHIVQLQRHRAVEAD